jgi:hypothetical protein
MYDMVISDKKDVPNTWRTSSPHSGHLTVTKTTTTKTTYESEEGEEGEIDNPDDTTTEEATIVEDTKDNNEEDLK